MFSSRNFLVLYFTFSSVINFDLILMNVIRSVSRFFFGGGAGGGHVDVQFWHYLLKILFLFHYITFAPLLKISCLYGSVSRLYCVPLTSYPISWLIPHCLNFSSFILSLEIKWRQSSNFVLQYCVGYSRPFASPYFIFSLFISIK